MTARPPRLLGWTAAAVASAALLSSAALALAATRRPAPNPLYLVMAEVPPAALSVAAVADPAPSVADDAPDLTNALAPMEEAAPDLPSETPAPMRTFAAALTLPAPEVPVLADLVVPVPEADPEPAPKTKPKPKPKEEKKTPEETPKPSATSRKPAAETKSAASAGATAPQAGAKASGGSQTSPAAYAKAVMKKVRATKKQPGAGKGQVLVGFTIAGDGSLSLVKVLKSSGNAQLDQIALDHIRRSSPFPPPPEGAGSSFSFEFIAK